MEDGLVLCKYEERLYTKSLNPCCNGRWSRTSSKEKTHKSGATMVLILVVMEDGLVLDLIRPY